MILVTRSALPPKEEYFEEIASLWDTHWLTNMGEKHERLQAALEGYLSVPHVSLFTNGHLALEGAIRALGLTGEVVTTPFTFASTTHAIVRCGLTPVFCDIDENDFTLDADRLEACITERTSAILPVHVYGNICNVEKIGRIAHKYGLRVLYDAAHAFGERVGGRGAADFGDASMMSFHATKVFHTIEGGCVTYRDEALTEKLHFERDFGILDAEHVERPGGNAKMNEFQAAMGLCNLKYVDAEIEKRRRVAARYDERLSDVPGLRLRAPQKDVVGNCAYYPVVFDGARLTRDEAAERLLKNGIAARKYFYPATNRFSCYRDLCDPDGTPVAQYVSEHVLTLPMYGELALSDVDRICDVLRND